jgi:hypothetical protein
MIVHHGSERKRPISVPSPKYSTSSLSTLFGWKDGVTDER